MRIENTNRTSGVGARSGAGRARAAASSSTRARARRRAAPLPIAQTSGIDALLALQSVEDPLLGKKKAMRRGKALLDTLEAIKADLLLGQVSEGRLNRLMALIGQARERGRPTSTACSTTSNCGRGSNWPSSADIRPEALGCNPAV